MSRKFSRMIAKEEFEDAGSVDLGEGDGEAAIIENEVNEEVGEVDHDNEEIEVISEGIEDASADAEQLEGIEGALTEAMDDPDHPGLDAVAVEAISAVLTMIQRNRGFNVTATRNIVAKENFDGSVAVRRTNTRAVLLSVGDTLKSIWESIKNALKTLWDKIKKFWGKHISTLGRLKKACDAMKKKINKTKGSPNLSKDVKAPGSFKRLYLGATEIDSKVFETYNARLEQAITRANAATVIMAKFAGEIGTSPDFGAQVESIKQVVKNEKVILGTNEEPLVGGFYGEVDVEVEDASTETKSRESVKLTFKKEQSDLDSKDDVDLIVGTKGELTNVANAALAACKYLQELAKIADKADKEFNKGMREIDKFVDNEYKAGNEDNAKETSKTAREMAKVFRTVGTVVPSINAKMSSLGVTQIKSMLQYCSISLSNYGKLGK